MRRFYSDEVFLQVLRPQINTRLFRDVASGCVDDAITADIVAAELSGLLSGDAPSRDWPLRHELILGALDRVSASKSGSAGKVFLAWSVLRWYPGLGHTSWSAAEVLGVLVESAIELDGTTKLATINFINGQKFDGLPQSFIECSIALLSAAVFYDSSMSLPRAIETDINTYRDVIAKEGELHFGDLDWNGGHGTAEWQRVIELIAGYGGDVDKSVLTIRKLFGIEH
jgi:hypothetical protein